MEPCIICIEDLNRGNTTIELDFKQYLHVGCSCIIHVHTECWMQYIRHKGHIECPICHKIFEHQNIRSQINQTEIIHINPVYQPPTEIIYVSSDSEIEAYRRNCFYTIILAAIFISVLVYFRVR